MNLTKCENASWENSASFHNVNNSLINDKAVWRQETANISLISSSDTASESFKGAGAVLKGHFVI